MERGRILERNKVENRKEGNILWKGSMVKIERKATDWKEENVWEKSWEKCWKCRKIRTGSIRRGERKATGREIQAKRRNKRKYNSLLKENL